MSGSFHELIAANRRRSGLLITLFLLLFAGTVYAFSLGFLGVGPREAVVPALVAVGLGGSVAALSYFQGAKAVLAMSGARELTKPEDPVLWNVVEELAVAGGVPMPRVYLIEDSALNAFATGRDPQHAAVAITRGLRQRLGRHELQGVLAHELSHVRNYDIRFSMMLAVMVGLLVLLADTVRRWLWWGGGRRKRSGQGGDGVVGGVVTILALLLALLAPMLAKIIQLAASREREYLADASAIELTRYPEGLASALEKLGGDGEVLETANRATQHLYIVNPFKPFEQRARGLFSTHPPLEERIRRLRALSPGPPSQKAGR